MSPRLMYDCPLPLNVQGLLSNLPVPVVTQVMSDQHDSVRSSFSKLSGVLAGVATPQKKVHFNVGVLAEVATPHNKAHINAEFPCVVKMWLFLCLSLWCRAMRRFWNT
jgi:hypothetical protein